MATYREEIVPIFPLWSRMVGIIIHPRSLFIYAKKEYIREQFWGKVIYDPGHAITSCKGRKPSRDRYTINHLIRHDPSVLILSYRLNVPKPIVNHDHPLVTTIYCQCTSDHFALIPMSYVIWNDTCEAFSKHSDISSNRADLTATLVPTQTPSSTERETEE